MNKVEKVGNKLKKIVRKKLNQKIENKVRKTGWKKTEEKKLKKVEEKLENKGKSWNVSLIPQILQSK